MELKLCKHITIRLFTRNYYATEETFVYYT